ncbi:MAG: restriction endonuclease subunit S, partial [Nitrospirae bacterium]|nr:restriction endonuclease subunit S [Nitrospirota bacterium]
MSLAKTKQHADKETLIGNLPEGWDSAILNSLITLKKGKKPSKLDEVSWPRSVPYIDIEAFEKGNIRRYADPATSTLVNAGDVLIVWDGARCGHVGKAPLRGALGSTLAAIEPVLIHPDFIFHFIQSCYGIINSNPRGIGIPHVEPEIFWNLKVSLSPLAEQKRIVEKVEELLARVNVTWKRLVRVATILKRFRQSVLTAACSGMLTAEWRERNPEVELVDTVLENIRKRRIENANTPSQKQKINEIYSYQEEADSDLLPESWRYVSLDKLCESFQYGTSKKSLLSGKVAVLRMGNIQDGEIDWSNLAYSSDEEEIGKYMLKPGDVLFNRTNSPELVGKSAIYRGEHLAIFAGYLIKINNFEELDSRYLNYCLNTMYARDYCLKVKTDGVSQSNINAQKLAKFEVPFCPLQEQLEIVCQVEALFKLADTIEKRVRAATVRAEKLTQAILAKAFRGELVPTEAELARREGRSYEPACELLSRIK